MKIGIVIPIYLRGNPINENYRATITYYKSLGYDLHLCGSEGKLSRAFCEPFLCDRVRYFEVPQVAFTTLSRGDDSLRIKFNRSLCTLRDVQQYDWYCLAGADDVAVTDLSELPMMHIASMAGVDNIGDGSLIIVPDGEEPYRVKLSYDVDLLPGINCFNHAAMVLSKWQPYRLKGCETGAEKYFESNGYIIPMKGDVVMLKGMDVLNTNEKIKRCHQTFALNDREMALVQFVYETTRSSV